jgi:hypothetical protein
MRAPSAASWSATSAVCSAASRVFEDAGPDDGRLEIGVVNADGVVDWVRTLARNGGRPR